MKDIRDDALAEALEALRMRLLGKEMATITMKAINSVKEAMAQPATQVTEERSGAVAPGEWQELTDEEAMVCLRLCGWTAEANSAAVNWQLGFARAVGAATRMKNVKDAA